jgi:hypothetical protein
MLKGLSYGQGDSEAFVSHIIYPAEKVDVRSNRYGELSRRGAIL